MIGLDRQDNKDTITYNSSGFVYPEENTAAWARLSSHQLREPNVNTLEQ
jgi:hypothetical protein